MPAGKVAFSSTAAPLTEPWARAETELVAYRQQMANYEDDEEYAVVGGNGGGAAGGQGLQGGGEGLEGPGLRPGERPSKRVCIVVDACVLVQESWCTSID